LLILGLAISFSARLIINKIGNGTGCS